jgi:hypothetical protein
MKHQQTKRENKQRTNRFVIFRLSFSAFASVPLWEFALLRASRGHSFFKIVMLH